MAKTMRTGLLLFTAALLTPVLMGAKGKGCAGDGTTFSKSSAPSMDGTWDVTYDDRLDVEITIGGATYTEQVGVEGGSVTIDHDGQPFTFHLDCSREDVVCPSEVYPAQVSFRQDDETFPHRVFMQLPTQECDGEFIDPEPSECGSGTNNPDCDLVCDGDIVTTTKEAYGTIDEPGERWSVALGIGIASNGVNCLLLGGSYAEGDLTTEGSAETEDWEAIATAGDVVTDYSGGCLIASDQSVSEEMEALVLAARVRLATGFEAAKR